MSCKVLVSNPEPSLGRVFSQLIHTAKCVPFNAPPFCLVHDSCKSVGHDVEVGANVTSKVLKIIAGIDDNGYLFGRKYFGETVEEASGPNAAGETSDRAKHADTLRELFARTKALVKRYPRFLVDFLTWSK